MHVDGALVGHLVGVAPQGVEQLLAADGALAVLHEVVQELELLEGEVQRLTVQLHLAPGQIDQHTGLARGHGGRRLRQVGTGAALHGRVAEHLAHDLDVAALRAGGGQGDGGVRLRPGDEGLHVVAQLIGQPREGGAGGRGGQLVHAHVDDEPTGLVLPGHRLGTRDAVRRQDRRRRRLGVGGVGATGQAQACAGLASAGHAVGPALRVADGDVHVSGGLTHGHHSSFGSWPLHRSVGAADEASHDKNVTSPRGLASNVRTFVSLFEKKSPECAQHHYSRIGIASRRRSARPRDSLIVQQVGARRRTNEYAEYLCRRLPGFPCDAMMTGHSGS